MTKEELLELLHGNSNRIAKLHSMFTQMNAVDIAEIFVDTDRDTVIQIFRLLPKSMAADVFSYIDPDEQQIIIEALTDREVSDIMNKLFVDDAVDMIEEMPAAVVNRLLQIVPDEKRKQINQILQYPDDSAGSIMTTEYVELRESASIIEAFEHIRTIGINKETIYTSYVIKPNRLLVGIVSAKGLMLAEPRDTIGHIMKTNFVFVHTTDDREIVAGLFKKYNLLSMPVVDREQHLVGIITVDDVMQVIEEENTEDFEKMAALNPSEEPYLKTSVLALTRNRILWLLFLMLSATITGGVIANFEEALAVLPMLVAFIPMLMDTGGNAGSQTSTLIIRGMALGEISFRDLALVWWKELRVGLLCGLGLGLINYLRIYLMNGKNGILSITVSLSLLITVVMAKTIGCILPMAAKKLKVDPAIMAAPIITTIVDGASLVVYLSIAKALFRI
ncbi:magnesium transporter [Treponema primitia ZAS-2]|uniref:Magnesium transporter MgtE n=1 Tax=Treponema primitia (strain ATCC BAA-887 / DSM 12427 / ZAS-2) TaxID=545694 RepID=F5YQF3_TREPZ|nr:magnesium transporter [Treponema primitia]AEF85505.1 magnesium transporter [Treponema primitia ZAS-2]